MGNGGNLGTTMWPVGTERALACGSPLHETMDCRAFRKLHLGYIDDTLPGIELVRMQTHLAECENCSAWDHQVRRSLMVARNHLLKDIEPSRDFQQRLAARLQAERRARIATPAHLEGVIGRGQLGAMVVGLCVIALATTALLQDATGRSDAPRLPAVAVLGSERTLHADEPPLDATPAIMATVSSGMAILPALMLADDALSASAWRVDTGVVLRAVSYTPDAR
jgi:hypothetical protein